MQKVILFYKFVPLMDPDALCLWQKNLAASLGLAGRIIIADHGINGTLGGDLAALKQYVKQTKTYPAFKDIIFKWSDGAGQEFPKLSVKVRDEIVTFGVADRIRVDDGGIIGGGQKLKPNQLHKLIEERGDDVVFFDGRNHYEAAVGAFKGAVVTDVAHSRDFPAELAKPKYDELKAKPVVTYCTGGIRCEVLTKLMKDEGFQEVYQLDGGIVKYGEQFGDDGLWEGALYVFDGRVTTKFSDDAQDIGECVHCQARTSRYTNCANTACNQQMIVCNTCHVKQRCPDCAQALV